MRRILVIANILALTVSAIASEDTLYLDRCQIVNHPTDLSLPSMLLTHFQLPEVIAGKEVLLAEITIRLGIRNLQQDSLLELRLSPLLSSPPEGDCDYGDIEAITDSLGAGVWTCRFDSAAYFQVDITEFMRAVAQRERDNFGLVGTLDLLGEANVILPENLAEAIQNDARVRVIFK